MPYKKLNGSYPQKYHRQETTKTLTSGKKSEQKQRGPEKLVTDEEKQALRQIYSEAIQSTHSLHECKDRNQAERFEAYLNWHFRNQDLQIECRVIREKEVNCFHIGLYEKKTPEEVKRIEWGNKKAVMKALIKKWGINDSTISKSIRKDILRLGDEREYKLLDLYRILNSKEYFQEDGIHLNLKGAELVADQIKKILLKNST